MTPNRHFHINDSGWRAVYADGFTIERLSAVVSALAQLFPKKKALVGFDNRFLSRELAHHAGWVLEKWGWNVDTASERFPTPGIAWLARHHGYDFGLVVTASHNPYYYNGLKILDHNGALIDRDLADRLEVLANKIVGQEDWPFDLHRPAARSQDFSDLACRYLDAIIGRVKAVVIRSAKLKVSWDGFGGTTPLLFDNFLDRLGVDGHPVPMKVEPTYGGRRLEPDAASLVELGRLTRESKSAVGLATDVDGDRFAVVDEHGEYVLNNSLATLLIGYLLESRGERGTVYQTVSSSLLSERIAKKFGVPFVTVPVGFLEMGRKMVRDPSPLVGVEETGGLAYAPHLPFKDGLMAHALVLEMLATLKKPLSQLIEEMFAAYGRVHYRRVDLKLDSNDAVEAWLNPELWERTVGEAVQSTSTIDGVKWYFPSGWLLIRRSKTEPLLRIYCESEDVSFVERIVQEAQ